MSDERTIVRRCTERHLPQHLTSWVRLEAEDRRDLSVYGAWRAALHGGCQHSRGTDLHGERRPNCDLLGELHRLPRMHLSQRSLFGAISILPGTATSSLTPVSASPPLG